MQVSRLPARPMTQEQIAQREEQSRLEYEAAEQQYIEEMKIYEEQL